MKEILLGGRRVHNKHPERRTPSLSRGRRVVEREACAPKLLVIPLDKWKSDTIIVLNGGQTMANKFPAEILATLYKEKIIGLKVGSQPHKFIGLWMVVAEGRLFVRSWSLTPGGWHATLVKEPVAEIQVGLKNTVVLKVRAVQTRSERLKDAVSAAYKAKYNTPGAAQYVKDLCGKKSRGTTTELVMV